MPTVRHPKDRDDVTGTLPARVTVNGDTYAVEDGRVTLPTDADVTALAAAYGLSPSALSLNQQDGTDDAEALVKSGVCPWCDEYDGDHVGQHASSAHPDEWDAYKSD